MTVSDSRPIVLITGATGNLGRSLGAALDRDYRIVGLDFKATGTNFPVFEADFTSAASLQLALRNFRDRFGSRIASVIHLVAYFNFNGEDNRLYQTVNIEGTRHLMRALQDFEVEQFVYASTMLVHRPGRPGERIDEQQPIEPHWAYPKSKVAGEAVIRAEHKRIPYVILRMAGVYDEHSTVPTMAHQMARIYERDFQSYFYSGSTLVGQAMLHRDDMLEAFRRAVDRRDVLPPETEILIASQTRSATTPCRTNSAISFTAWRIGRRCVCQSPSLLPVCGRRANSSRSFPTRSIAERRRSSSLS